MTTKQRSNTQWLNPMLSWDFFRIQACATKRVVKEVGWRGINGSLLYLYHGFPAGKVTLRDWDKFIAIGVLGFQSGTIPGGANEEYREEGIGVSET